MPTLRALGPEPRDYMLGERTEIGRNAGVALAFPSSLMSRRHACVERRAAGYFIVDLGSASGTWVDDTRGEVHRLRPGARVRVGDQELEFLAEPEAEPAALGLPPPRISAHRARADGTIEAIALREGLVGAHADSVLRVETGFKRHARLIAFAGGWWIEALDGPVELDGAPTLRARLRDGAALGLGATRVVLRLTDDRAPVLRVYADGDPRSFVDHPLGARTRVGKHGGNDVVIADSRVSREHCQIWRSDDGLVIEDLHSTNGVTVNGEAVERGALRHGDRVEIGRALCVVLDPPGEPTPALRSLEAAFVAAGLPSPPVPAAFVPLLQVFAPWWFGTRRTPGLYQGGTSLFAEADDAAVKDFLITGHAGHGLNSYAIHYFLRHEGALLLFEFAFGGVYTDPARSTADVAEAFAAAAAIVDALGSLRRRGVPRAGLRLIVSSVRLSQWQAGVDGGAGNWREVLRDAVAWARSDAAYRGAPAPSPPVPGDSPAAGVREDEHRVRVYTGADAAPFDLRIGAGLVVGRGHGCGLQVADALVSRQHCRFFEQDGCCLVEDLASADGTRVEGRKIAGACVLAHGARIDVRGVELIYCEAGRPCPPRFRSK